MQIYHYIAIFISTLSLGVSIFTFRQSYKLNLDTRNLNFRKVLSEQFDEYSTLLHSEYWKLKDDLSNLSSILCHTNSGIGQIFDEYDSREKNMSSEYQRYLRHLYVDLHRDIASSFEYELSWQTTENIYSRLEIFRHLDHEYDLKKVKKPNNIFSSKENNTYNDYTLKESKAFIDSFIELTESIKVSDSMEFYNEFVEKCNNLIKALKQIQIKCKKSYNFLESATIKNNLQEFKLWEYSPLYTKYNRFKCLMNFIDKTRISDLESISESPYLTVSQIVYYGANIDMINKLLCKTIFSFEES